MATDKSEPRVGLIFRIGIVSAVLLAVTRAALGSYFDEITQAEEDRKIVEAKPLALLSLRSDEKRRLTEGPLPIAQAMHEFAAKGRTAASPDIAPAQSKDLSPLQGWMRMPAVVPVPMTSAESGAVPADASAAPPSASARSTAPAVPKKKP